MMVPLQGIAFFVMMLFFGIISPALSASYTICMPHAAPPYSEGKKKTGLHVDIIQAAFAHRGDTAHFIFLPNNRIEKKFLSHKCDMATHMKINNNTKSSFFTRVPMMTYYNDVIYKKTLDLSYKTPEDLLSLRVGAFQNAHKFLGDAYAEMARNNVNYIEYGNYLPVHALTLDRLDVIVSEPNVFLYYLNEQLRHLSAEDQKHAYDSLQWTPFNSTGNSYHWAFQDNELLQRFEAGLTALYTTNEFEEIFNKWAEKYNLFRAPLSAIDCAYGRIESACHPDKTLRVLFGSARPPYITSNPPSGIIWSLSTEIFKRMHYQIIPSFASNARMTISLEQGLVDAAVEVQKTNPKLHYSDPFIFYQNFIFTHRKDQITFTEWADLKDKVVCTWQGAAHDLGPSFQEAISLFAHYKEFGDQRIQVQRWLYRSCDVTILDKTLFKWWTKTFETEGSPTLNQTPYKAFPVPKQDKLWWYVGFTNPAIRDQFNEHLSALRSEGHYDKAMQIKKSVF